MLTQETLNNHIIDIRCKAGNLAASWSNKVKLGKWCDEQECALVLADWGLDILCSHTVCGTPPVEVLSQIEGILQQNGFADDHFLLLPITVGYTLNLYVNGDLVDETTIQPMLQGFNYNMATIMYNYFGDSLTMYNGNTIYETPQEVPIGELIYYNVTTPCDEPISDIFINIIDDVGGTSGRFYITEPTPWSKDMVLYGPTITPGVCVFPCTSCLTDEQICKLVGKLNKVLTFKCDCC